MENQEYLEPTLQESLLDTTKLTKELSHLKGLIDPDNKEFQNDKIANSAQRALLATLISTIPTAVEHYKNKPGQGSAYALSNLIGQINELFQEIRSGQNLENQVEYISEEILLPMIKAIITNIFDKTYYIKQELKGSRDFIDKPELLDKVFAAFDKQLKEIGPILNKQGELAEERLKQYLLEV